MIEAQFQDLMVEKLRRQTCYVKPLVGNMLMSGMPDIFVISKYNSDYHTEFKVWRNQREPVEHDFFNLLKGPQRNVIPNEFWKRGIFCPIAALWQLDDRTCWVYEGSRKIQFRTDIDELTWYLASYRKC